MAISTFPLLEVKDIDKQDEFLLELVKKGIQIHPSLYCSAHSMATSDLIKIIDQQIPLGQFHRSCIQIAQLRDHQYFKSIELQRHLEPSEIVKSWIDNGYAEKFNHEYFERFVKSHKPRDYSEQAWMIKFAESIRRTNELTHYE